MQALLDKLRKPEYQGLSDQAAADKVNSEMIWIRDLVDTADAITHAAAEGYYANFEDARNRPAGIPGTPQDQCRQVAINILKFIESPKTQKIDMDSQKVVAMKIAMTECGFATVEQVASLDALADKLVRWVDHNGIGTLGRGGIQNARLEISRGNQ